MQMQAYVDEVRLRLTGNLTDIELDDATLSQIVTVSLREMQRYIDSTRYATIPFSPVIDLSKCKVSTVNHVYRAETYGTMNPSPSKEAVADPMYLAQWQLMSNSNGSMYNLSNFTYNYAAYNTAQQIRNTLSTDLSFRYDKHTSCLYINVNNVPTRITIEYVPRYDDVSEIVSDYWIDILVRLAVANTKIALGRIRSKYKQSNAPWGLDGDTLLEEGNNELSELRTQLEDSTQLCYPID